MIRLFGKLIGSVIGLTLGAAIAVLALILRLVFGPLWRRVFPPHSMTAVPYVLDGDSLAFDGDIRVRMYGIDAPEMDHPEGPLAKAHLIQLIGGQPVRVVHKATDKYNRLVCQVFAHDGTDICAAMVANGYARAYTSFSRSYTGLERKAQRSGAGLWGRGGLAIHPELWRKAQK